MFNIEAERLHLIHQIQNVQQIGFEKVALQVFQYQAQYCSLYRQFLNLLRKHPKNISCLSDIPFLPIELFKSHTIKSGDWQETDIFLSSGTTGQTPSRHHVRSMKWYQEGTLKTFQQIYGSVDQFCILALLPSYLERSGSSLVAMVDYFIRESKYQQSGFHLDNFAFLNRILQDNKSHQIPTLLIGVSFALLDFAEQYPNPLGEHTIVMETGGMKGRRKEMTRPELHQQLKQAFGVKSIHSEYGMTELFAQAYAPKDGIFHPASTMQVRIHSITDPFDALGYQKRGLINIIDLANLDTISFIGTQDIGIQYPDGSFEVLGRLDHSEIRGCNLMVLPRINRFSSNGNTANS